MSFGSQGETPFRIYAEAARRLNIICMNGEGGKSPTCSGSYRKNRGQQIASGRFGVNMEFLNSADFLEIKVGQGAKPGEGGHLPGFKVTAKIAAARNATPGVSLISPSNNHDIYSIEDLAQIIEELRTANPDAHASRSRCRRWPGSAPSPSASPRPAPTSSPSAAMTAAPARPASMPSSSSASRPRSGCAKRTAPWWRPGMRDRVEIWADGGARTGRDVVKLMLLGANRVGFGTMAMVIIGCTTCRGCHLGTCHVGIATQIETVEEARAKGAETVCAAGAGKRRHLRNHLFPGMAREITILTAKLGFQPHPGPGGPAPTSWSRPGAWTVSIFPVSSPRRLPERCRRDDDAVRIIRKPLNYLTSLISGLVTEAFDRRRGAGSLRRRQRHQLGPGHRHPSRRALTRAQWDGRLTKAREALLHFRRDSIPGNGLGAFTVTRIAIRVEGGAQDGVGKSASGGKIVVLKGENRHGVRVGGSVGKGLAYGAQGGTFLIQGDADSRACIRLSGADVVLGGRIRSPSTTASATLADRANLKGFACEYMTAGRVVVLGDPGPWICSGMTGGVVYCHLDLEMGLDREALRRRMARGAGVEIRDLEEDDVRQLEELLLQYHRELLHSHQEEEADWLEGVISHCRTAFVKIVPEHIPAPLPSDE